ncbi:MAG: hypothetical protein U1E42_00125 [Rhodospirillales bacterium]
MALSKEERLTKLHKLAEIEGYETVSDMLEATTCDAVSPAICVAEDCDYTVEMEPDQDQGWCDQCHRNTVVAALVLAELI